MIKGEHLCPRWRITEYRNLAVAKRAAVIGCLLPPDRDEAVAVATSAVDHRRTD